MICKYLCKFKITPWFETLNMFKKNKTIAQQYTLYGKILVNNILNLRGYFKDHKNPIYNTITNKVDLD